MPAPRGKAANRAKQAAPTVSKRAAPAMKKTASTAVKPSLPASKKRKRQPVPQPAQEDDEEEEEETDDTHANDEVDAEEEEEEEVVVENKDNVDGDAAATAVKQEEKQSEHYTGVGSSRTQQIEVNEEDEDDISLSSSDSEQDTLLKQEGEEDADAPFDELALPLRLYIGTYTGSLYALESLHSLHHLLTSPPLPPVEPQSAATSTSAGRTASSFYTLFNTDAHRASIHAVACSPQGSHLVSSGVDEVVQLYRLEGERRHVGSLHRHYASVNQLLFPSSHTFLSASDDGTVAVFSSVRQWEMVKRLSTAGTAGVVCMSLHPSHRVLLTSSSDGVVRMWDMIRGVEATRRRVKFDHPSVTAGGSGQAREEVRVQWEEAGKGYVMVRGKVLTVYDEQGAIHRVVHADSRILTFHFIAPSLLVAGCEDYSLRCWDADTGEQLWIQQQHTARIRCLDYLRLSDEQLLLVSASTDGQVWVWRGRSEGGVRASVERVAGAKSEARITAVCCGVRWDARRSAYKGRATAAAPSGADVMDGEEEEKSRVAVVDEEEVSGTMSKKDGKKSGRNQASVGSKSHQQQMVKSAQSAVREEGEEDGMVKTGKQKRKQQKKQVNKQQGNDEETARERGQQPSRANEMNGQTKQSAQVMAKRGVTVVNHKRRAR